MGESIGISSPSHDELSQILEDHYRRHLGTDVAPLLCSCNFNNLDVVRGIMDDLPEPNGLDCVVFASWSKLWWKSIGKNERTRVVLMESDFELGWTISGES